MRLLIVDEEIIAGGVETLRRRLIPELVELVDRIVWVLPAHVLERYRAMAGPNLRLEALQSPGGLARVREALARRRDGAVPRALIDSRLRRVAAEHGCTVAMTTCVFGQAVPETGLPVAGWISDVNPALPREILANMTEWVRKADAIFTVSDFTAGEVARMCPGAERKIQSIPLAADGVKEIQPGRSGAFYYPAAPNEHKNHLVLLEAARRLVDEDFQLTLTGAGLSDETNPSVRKMRDFLGAHSGVLKGRVHLAGDADAATVERCFAEASCVVLPSAYEGFGLPLTEALARGKRVICSDIAPFREQVRRYACEALVTFVPVGDAAALEAAMRREIERPDGQPDIRPHLANWTWADAARRCVALLGRIANPAPLRTEDGLAARVRWHVNRWMLRNLRLAPRGTWITVRDSFGAPGDTLLTTIVCREIAQRFPGLRINCITPNPDLLREDPNIAALNLPETCLSLRHWYLDLLNTKDWRAQVLGQSMAALGIVDYKYQARVYLTDAEINGARARLAHLAKPVITINARSKEPVKTWPVERWVELCDLLRGEFDLVQLGDATEPELSGVFYLAGKLSMRESMAVLAQARLHIGPDSFLMHAANGVGVRSVILFGGSRTVENSGYAENVNLFVPMPCGPCYIHESRGETCAHGIECMQRITVTMVHDAVRRLLR